MFNFAAEEAIPFIDIATAVANGLKVPIVSKSGADAEAHFDWFTRFAALDCTASSELTRKSLGWEPKEAKVVDEISSGLYF